jgi:hypothetical protein
MDRMAKPVKLPEKLRLGDLRQIRALSNPLRLRLLEQFAAGARTTKQAAAALGEPLTKLYHHVHALERAGLLVVRGTRRVRGVVEKSYEVAARQFEVEYDAFGGDLGAALAAAAVGAGRQASAGAGAGRRAKPLAVKLLVPGGARAARRLFTELLAVVRNFGGATGGGKRAAAAPWVLSMTLTPAERPRRR